MKARSVARTPLGVTLLVIVLIASSALGLLAGTLTHTLTSTAQTPPTTGVNPGGPRQPGATTTATPGTTGTTASPTTAAATATTAPIITAFTLSIHAEPSQGAPGQSITILVAAQSKDTGEPLAGLTCFLRGPSQGGEPLLQDWPTPVATDTNGQASWTVVIPQEAPGAYRVETVAQLKNNYTYYAYTTVTVTG